MPAPTTAPQQDTPVAIIANHHTMPKFRPAELRFVFSRAHTDWGRFTLAWSLDFQDYELDTIVDTKDDDTQVNVWLRLKKESLDASKSAA